VALKILILKPSSLGDVIHALPVLRLLKRHWPGSLIYWWLDINLVPLLENDPDLAGIYAFQRNRWAAPRHWREIYYSINAMRGQRFDLAIDLQGLARSSMFAWLADAGTTVT
jgi:ADP-heptose:LPS heptosyltransferase